MRLLEGGGLDPREIVLDHQLVVDMLKYLPPGRTLSSVEAGRRVMMPIGIHLGDMGRYKSLMPMVGWSFGANSTGAFVSVLLSIFDDVGAVQSRFLNIRGSLLSSHEVLVTPADYDTHAAAALILMADDDRVFYV